MRIVRRKGHKTTNMLLDVAGYITANPQHRVVVWAHNSRFAKYLQDIFRMHMGDRWLNVEFKRYQLNNNSHFSENYNKEFIDNSVWDT